jgi:osmotically-inducible protein OsmY
MKLSAIAVFLLAGALPAAAQQSYSSTTTTITAPGSSAAVNLVKNGTHVTGSTAHETAAPSSAAADDQATLSRIASALVNDPQMADATVDVRVENGHVTLTGTALTPGQAARAQEIASNTAGGGKVTNRVNAR